MKRTAILATCLWVVSASAQNLTTLASFDGADGAGPSMSLVQGLDGNFYGTTLTGGAGQDGTVFKVTPTGAITALHSFNNTEGSSPFGGLALNTDGNLYGTTEAGGSHAFGTVFRITPAGTFTLLHNFCVESGCPDGAVPAAGLVLAANGQFYGTTYLGGGGGGTIFRISATGQFLDLYADVDENSLAGLVQGTDNNFYGTAEFGGFPPPGGISSGTIFKITPPGLYTELYDFCQQYACADGANPSASLVEGADGTFYGTTYAGGAYGYGSIFNITTTGALTTLYSFCAQSVCTDGANPYAGLTLGTDGNFYGTTYYGGVDNRGTVFKVATNGEFTTLYSFCAQSGCPDGDYVYGGLVQGTDGSFYGTTYQGGTHDDGTIFKLSVGLGPFVTLLPGSGHTGTKVNILGTNLTGATSVTFNGTPAVFSVVSSSVIEATAPAGVTTGIVQVVTLGGTLSSNLPFRVTR